ncbi:TPA: replication initiation protein [Streptococcus suis]
MINSKADKALEDLLSRGDYLVVQSNDLAKSFGNLKGFEHRILDYCFSFVKQDSKPEERFVLETSTLLKHLQLSDGGPNYERVARAFKSLNENTALYLPITKENGAKAIRMTQLFAYIDYDQSGRIEFEFSKFAQPYVFDLKKNFYSFHLRELANIKSKYALILLKLWEAHRYQKRKVTLIEGNAEDWQNWFLGDKKRMTAGVFKRDILTKAIQELEKKMPVQIQLKTIKKGRNVVGYELQIFDLKKPGTVDLYKAFDKHDQGKITFEEMQMQTTIYDFLD